MPDFLKQILPLLKQHPQIGLAVLAIAAPAAFVKLEVMSGWVAFAFPVAIYSLYAVIVLSNNRTKERVAALEVRRIEVEGEARIGSKMKRARDRLRKRKDG